MLILLNSRTNQLAVWMHSSSRRILSSLIWRKKRVISDLQRRLPAALHVQVSPLYALVVGVVKPFGEVFFEERPHHLIRGPALQNGQGRGGSTDSTGRLGLFDVKPSKQIIFHSSYEHKSNFGIVRIPTNSSAGPHSRLRRGTQDKVS